MCANCGMAFRGPGAVTTPGAGEAAEVVRTAKPREKIRWGLLGLVGGFLGILGIPTLFLIGGALRHEDVINYVGSVFNRPSGAIACGGIVLLVLGGWYAMWAGFHVWRGYAERSIHGMFSGILVILAALAAGQGAPSVVGLIGGILALVGGLLVYRATREKDEGEAAPPAAEST